MSRVTVIGATSLIGHFLLPQLAKEGWRVTAISRQTTTLSIPSHGTPAPVRWLQQDITKSAVELEQDGTLVSLAPIWLLGDMLERVSAPPARIIAFSSTSILTKRHSTNPKERQIAVLLESGENAVRQFAARHDLGWTILRPTLVYGAGLDKNVSMITDFIQRFRFFPLIGSGIGKRMPVHAEDLSQAVMQCLREPVTSNQTYELPGGETLSYREMVTRIFAAIGMKPRFLGIPVPVARTVLQSASLIPRFADLTAEMADRTQQDLVFDGSKANQDFSYTPRPFRPERADLVRAD